MKTTTRSALLPILMALALAGCDAPAERATSPRDAADPVASKTDSPAGALESALRQPDAYARARSLGELLPSLGPEAVREVKQALDDLRIDLGAVEIDLLVRFWATHQPAAATAWTFKKASPIYQSGAARTAMEVWAEADPASAVIVAESALRTANEDVAWVVQQALVQGWFKTDRPGLEQYMQGLGIGIQRQRALFAYLISLARTEGSEATVRWADTIPDDDARYKLDVYRQVMSMLTWADMRAAERFCDAHCDGPYGKGLRNALSRSRLRDGDYGGDVVEWVASVPDGDEEQRESKKHSLWVAYSVWAYRDRQAAIDWMKQKTAGAEVEPWVRLLFAEYARQLAQDSPQEAIEWAERVEDEADRQRALVRVAQAWRQQDELAAEAWLSQSSLPEPARALVRSGGAPD